MKILAVSHLFPNVAEPRYGIFVARQLTAMAQEGASIELLVPRLYSPSWLMRLLRRPNRMFHRAPLVPADGVVSHSLVYFARPGKSFKRRAGTAMFRAIRAKAASLHQQKQFDVVYGTDWFLGGEAARRLGVELNIPSACLAIGDDINVTARESDLNRKQFVDIAGDLSATLACGDSLARQIDAVRNGGTTLSVYGVVDLERFQPSLKKSEIRSRLGLPTQATILLYAGYLWKRKGLLELIQAFEELAGKRDDLLLVLCGGGEDQAVITEQAEKSKFSSRIRFVGTIEPRAIHEWMQSSDVFVLPSYSEGMPNAVMEAMACGLPVVSTSVGGLPDALNGCRAASLVAPRDAQALSQALALMIADSDKMSQMADTSRAFAAKNFGARPNARRILGHLQRATEAFPGSI